MDVKRTFSRRSFKNVRKPDFGAYQATHETLTCEEETQARRELEELLQGHSKLYKKTFNSWPESLQMDKWDAVSLATNLQEIAKTPLAVMNTKYPYSLKIEYRRKTGELLINIELLQRLCDMLHGILKSHVQFSDDEINKYMVIEGQMKLVGVSITSAIWNHTNHNLKVSEVVAHHQLMQAWVAILDKRCQVYAEDNISEADGNSIACGSENSDVSDSDKDATSVSSDSDDSSLDLDDLGIDSHRLIEGGLAVIHNTAMYEQNITVLREIKDIFQILLRYTTCSRPRTRLEAVMALAEVATDAEAEIIATSPGMIQYLLHELCVALDDEKRHKSKGWAVTELVQAVKGLARNDTNKRRLVENGVLPLMVKGLKSDVEDERKGSIESLWWLSFDEQNRSEMIKDEDLLSLVISIYCDRSHLCNSAAEGVLFQLRELLHCHSKQDYRSVAAQLMRAEERATTSGHVMFSYQTAQREVVKMVCDYLSDNGIKVWMDIYNMSEGESSTTQTMAEAVENSTVFVMCVSESYKNSQYCRQEAEYAFENKKHITPLKLQRDYRPDGWLGLIQGGKYFFDFTHHEYFHSKMADLLKSVRKVFSDKTQDSPDGRVLVQQRPEVKEEKIVPVYGSHGGLAFASPSPRPKPSVSSFDLDKIRNWTQEDVEQWLCRFDLKSQQVQALTGKEIAFLIDTKSEAPEFFYQLLTTHLHLRTVAEMANVSYALKNLQSSL